MHEDLAQRMTRDALLAALAIQWDAGVTEIIEDRPQSAYDLPERMPGMPLAPLPARQIPLVEGRARAPAPAETVNPVPVDPVAAATSAAGGAQTLAELHAALAAYAHCDLKRGARNTVFADGIAGARVMILGEAPGREEDLEGRPFVGRAGQFLDRMFAAIGLSRTAPDPASALYITNVMPWRPPNNRDPEPAEIAMMRPFVERHIALAAPDFIVLMGNTPCAALLGKRGILKLRGHWTEALGRPVLPMAHPAYLLRMPIAKREAWADLQALRDRLAR